MSFCLVNQRQYTKTAAATSTNPTNWLTKRCQGPRMASISCKAFTTEAA